MKLSNVTLIALTGFGYKTEEHLDALIKSTRGIQFGEVKLIQLGHIHNIDDWNKAVVYDLWRYVDTGFAMFVHADGYVINPEMWDFKWFQYDYIGAPWPLPTDDYSYRDPLGNVQRVGNSVSLRSKRLMQAPWLNKFEWKPYHGNTNEDGFLCVHNRKKLEDLGMKFAPVGVAAKFSKEHEIPENKDIEKTFAFHSTNI